ncbi:MAG: 7TM diverse intracellular signaling domain-containing protein [Candidatus Pedobacter colombiensis]|uniref:7TM diverse intracellular signaling domain-containing protein n=1 Tax=Candidatus Pedobacter colombiensis TaxID=3121371 RepID=A0AAJ5W759_9SPHI|nr:7TM diverse intracellular signaling domain-containing protein [Pedobacter sp.]WEK19239.1 MAG: 7TM diverse intracellular signaling domain-containing protein [Pedobacter sp.]
MSKAQDKVLLNDSISKHIFIYKEIEYFIDTTNSLTINDVTKPSFSNKFKPSKTFTPTNYQYLHNGWYRIKINHSSLVKNSWVLEFFDQTIEEIHFYTPDHHGKYSMQNFGAARPFDHRIYFHKNFVINLDTAFKGDRTYYFSAKSSHPSNVMVVLKPVVSYFKYALKEYYLFGIYYGMILIFSLYNFMMFLAVKQKQYIYYIVYNLSIGMFEMSSNGIAYQYLWPDSPEWNGIAFGVMLYIASISSMLFTREFLYTKTKAPTLNKLILGAIGLRTLFFASCLFIDQQLFNYKYIEIFPLIICYFTGWYVYRKGYRPARFFVAGYTFLVLGVLIRVVKTVYPYNLPFGPANFYSLSFCFIMEMLFVSFAISDKVRLLKKKKDKAQSRMFQEIKLNQRLKDNQNKELEKQVLLRTKEVIAQSEIIKSQNEELLNMNELLNLKAEEINKINEFLKKDNIDLQIDIEKVSQARVMSKEVDFTEFSKIYPDNNACFKFLAELKWNDQYNCRKCDNENHFEGETPFSRRCSKCGYDESVTTNTIFHNSKIPINKAFYIIFLMYSSNGKISSYKLSEILSMRQGTCWAYSNKVKKIMEERKKELKNAGEKGWSKLVLG